MAPQAVKVVVLPFGSSKDVDNNHAVVEEEPAGIYRTFDMAGQHAFFLQALLQSGVRKEGEVRQE